MRALRMLFFVGLAFIFVSSSLIYAAVPQMINYQGKITTPTGALVDTTVQMIFTIYDDSTSGNTLWADTVSSVSVQKGIFSVLLGSGNPIPDSVFDGNIRYLGTKVGTDAEMTPRKAMVSVAYAYRAGTADGGGGASCGWVDDGTVIRLETQTDSVGIGTTTPGYKLHLQGSSTPPNPLVYVDQTGTGRGLWVNTVGGACALVAEAGNHGLRVIDAGGDGIHVENAGGWAGYFDGTGYFSGNVGMGTTSPGANLDIVSTNPNLRVGTTSGSPVITLDKASGFWGYLEFREAGASKWQAGVTTGNDYYILNWPSSRYVFYANSAGDVGIGTTSPGSKLEIRDSGTLQFAINNTSGRNWVMRSDNAGKFSLWDFSSLNDAFIVTSSGAPDNFTFEFKGDVGIGTPSPGSKLEIKGDGALQFAINNISGRNWVMRSDNTGKFSLWDWSGLNDAFVVTSSGAPGAFTFEFKGNVGIGTTSPGANLDIVSANPNLRVGTASGSPVITLDKASGYWGYLEFRDAGASKWQAGVTSGNDYYILNWPSSRYVFYANSAGNVGMGTTSPTSPLDVNGNDIRIRTSQTPASTSADGYTGEVAWDASYIYICTSGDGPGGGTDSWKRTALSTW
ncbi:MAG: hypothetical protein WBD28_05885 [Candidatus Zixiibacteriota bacterium]